jgi:hypothetical protein
MTPPEVFNRHNSPIKSSPEETSAFVLPYFIDSLTHYLDLFETILIKSSERLKKEDIYTLLRRGNSPLRGEAK